MEYCGGYNGNVYHHLQQHTNEFRYKNGMTKVGYNNNNSNNSINNYYNNNNVYQHISWNGMHHSSHHTQHPYHHPYGNRNLPAQCHYDSYKANMVQNCFQSSYSTNFETPYELASAAASTPAAYRSRFGSSGGVGGGAYPICDSQQCFPMGENNTRTNYTSLNGDISRCINPLNNILATDPENHLPFMQDSSAQQNSNMRMLPHSNHRAYDSHPRARQFETGHHQPWYGNPHNSNNTSETINESNHHYYQHHAMNKPNYNDYSHGNQYVAGHMDTTKEDKSPKIHRDRSLSKLVAMNRRLETQMNDAERIEPIHHEPFENFDYYTDYSATPDSITSPTQYTSNDCIKNNGDTDNNNNTNGVPYNSQKSNCKQNRMEQTSNDTELQTTPAVSVSASTLLFKSSTRATTPVDATKISCRINNSNFESSVKVDGKSVKKNDFPSFNVTINLPAKNPTNKKLIKSKKANNIAKENSSEKRRRRKEKKSNSNFKTDTIPLPGFQQAFGSTEIGRFSEIFFNISGSPIEIGLFESEAETLSPQPWEMGDSLEGPHFSIQANNTPLSYAESLGSTDSPTASNNSYFSDLRLSEF